MSQPLWWYTIRASGLVAWVLLLGAVAWGLVLSIRPIRKPRPAWALDLHRFLGGLAFVFIGAHLVGLLFDTFVGFSVVDLLVPMASHWRPGAVALGVVAMYLAVAVEVTSLLMRRLPRRIWHSIHLSSLVALVLVTVHAFTAGADAGSPLVIGLAVVSTGVVVALAGVRVASVVRTRGAAAAVSTDAARIALAGPVTAPVRAAVPPPPRDPRSRRGYDANLDPLFLPLAVPAEPAVRAPAPASLPSGETTRSRVRQ